MIITEARLKYWESLKGKPGPWLGRHHSQKTKDLLREKRKLQTTTKKTRILMSITRKNMSLNGFFVGANHPSWVGEKIGYMGLHNRVRKALGTPDTCEHCGRTGLKGRQIGWANKDHQYSTNLSDWIRLCGSCHYKYDKKYNGRKKGGRKKDIV